MSVISATTIQLPGDRRLVGAGRTICSVCGKEVQSVDEHPRRRMTYMVARAHGSPANRCPGSRQRGMPWLDACQLPTWQDMTDHDKGQALAFVTKACSERDYAYTRKNWPVQYTGPGLDDLAAVEPVNYYSARHASAVVDTLGDRLESVPNPLSGFPATLLRVHPPTMREPASWMAQRVLGDEYHRLIEAAS